MTLPAGAGLGATSDPKALILGEPTHVDTSATQLSDEATRIQGLASQFAAVRVSGWTGGHGHPAYVSAHEAEQAKWTAYGELLTAAGASLKTYAAALRTAQSRAQDAIDKWQAGEDATATAVREYNASVTAYNSSLNQCVTVPSYGGGGSTVPSMGPAHPGVFHDPGAAMRDEAQQILDDAREALESAGATGVKELGGLEGARTTGSSGSDISGSAEGPSFSWDAWEDTFGQNPAEGKDGAYDAGASESPFKISLGKVEGNAHVWGAEGTWEDYVGDVKVSADGSVTVLGVKGDAEASVSNDGLVIAANGTVTVVAAEGATSAEWGYLEGGLKAEAAVEANAEGEVLAGRTGVHASGELFAGGKAGITSSVGVGGVGGELTAEAWAGAGAGFDADIGYDDGKLTVGGSGGLAWGVGGKLGGAVIIDFEETWDTAGDIVDGIGGLFS